MQKPWLWTWLATFVVVVAAGQAAVGMRASWTASITGDEPFYLLTTQSLLSDGDLDLRDEYRDREYEDFWDGRIDLWRQMEPAAGGRLLSPHNPGLSVLVLPAYAVAGLAGVQRFLVVLWAAAMACAAVASIRMGAPPPAAGLAAIAVGAGAPGLVYASQIYPEGPAALCIAVALLVLSGRRPRPVVMAVGLSALVWLGVKYAPLAAVAVGAWAWRFRAERRAVAALAVMGAVSAAAFAAWHVRTFGGVTPYGTNVVWAGESTTEIVGDHVRLRDRSYRLYGVYLDARFGLVRWLPVTVLGVPGVRRATGVALALVATATAVAAFASITIMGWWFPGRGLVAVLPAAVALIAFGIARLPVPALVLTAWSLAVAAAVAWSARSGGIRLAVDPWELGLPLPPAWLFPDFRAFGWQEVGVSVGWGVATVAALALLTFVRARPPSRWVSAHERPTAGGAEAVPPTP